MKQRRASARRRLAYRLWIGEPHASIRLLVHVEDTPFIAGDLGLDNQGAVDAGSYSLAPSSKKIWLAKQPSEAAPISQTQGATPGSSSEQSHAPSSSAPTGPSNPIVAPSITGMLFLKLAPEFVRIGDRLPEQTSPDSRKAK